MIPRVLAYHPRIGVRGKDGEIIVIQADLPDFAFQDEVLGMMGQVLHVETAGEVVEAIASGVIAKACLGHAGCLNCSVEHSVQSSEDLDSLQVVDWDHRIV